MGRFERENKRAAPTQPLWLVPISIDVHTFPKPHTLFISLILSSSWCAAKSSLWISAMRVARVDLRGTAQASALAAGRRAQQPHTQPHSTTAMQ